MSLATCDERIKFNLDCNFTVERVELENVTSFNFRVNDELVDLVPNLLIKEGSEVKISKVRRRNLEGCSVFTIYGVEKDIVYDDRKNDEEISDNQQQVSEVREIYYEDNKCSDEK